MNRRYSIATQMLLLPCILYCACISQDKKVQSSTELEMEFNIYRDKEAISEQTFLHMQQQQNWYLQYRNDLEILTLPQVKDSKVEGFSILKEQD